MNRLPRDPKLDIGAFENMLDPAYMTNSYKIYWFFSIFEEIKRGRTSMTFHEIILRMLCKAWYSVVQYKLSLGLTDQIGKFISDIRLGTGLMKSDLSESELYRTLRGLDSEFLRPAFSVLACYVPYRLLTPFYEGALRKMPDQKKNAAIEGLSRENGGAIYRISGDSIEIDGAWADYVLQNQLIIEGWLNYRLICYLQRKNPSVPAIPLKIYPPQKRELAGARRFWSDVISARPLSDIYTGRPLSADAISIDHFIPWSFVMHDELWNLVPTTHAVNSSKSDGLPDLSLYLENFCDVQLAALATAVEKGFHKKDIECYFGIGFDPSSKTLDLGSFRHRLMETVRPLHQLAANQGFPLWRYPG